MQENPIEIAAAGPDTSRLTAHLPVPGLGVLPASAFLIRAAQPVLVDTGVAALSDATFAQLCSLIDPADLRYIWLTHTDQDHVGGLARLLEAAVNARVVTTFLGMGKLGLHLQIAPERVYLLNPGQRLDVGDRSLLSLRPPSFDAPETTAVFDSKSRSLFSADSFGAVLPQAYESARDVDPETLSAGLCTWGQIDAPWLSWIDASHFEASVRELRALAPQRVLSCHLPPAPDMLERLIELLDRTRGAAPFVGPDQRALVEMLTAAA